MGIWNNRIRIEIAGDGVYIIVDHLAEKRVTRSELLQALEGVTISDLDFTAINSIFSMPDDLIRVCVSKNKNVVFKNESAVVEMDPSRLKAFLMLTAPGLGGTLLSESEIKKVITAAGVTYGVIDSAIKSITSDRKYDYRYLVAQGKDPIDGVDGKLSYCFDTQMQKNKPKVLSDGSVNFHDMQILQSIEAGQVLVETIPPSDGENGIDVTGGILNYKPGKPSPLLPSGKFTKVSDDGRKLIATKSGQILFLGRRVDILPVFDIKGDVGPSTGDIFFTGSVTISGNVLSNFSVIAEGSIEINGVVEGAIVRSKAGIKVLGGIQGSGKAEVEAGESLIAKFAENAKLTSGGDMTLEAVLDCDIACEGNLYLQGRRGILVGGKVVARESIFARTVGSVMATPTEITIGYSPGSLNSYSKHEAEYKQKLEEISKLDYIVNHLTRIDKESGLAAEQKELLYRSLKSRLILRNEAKAIQEDIEQKFKPRFELASGTLTATEIIRPGVKISIGKSTLNVKDEITSCVLKEVDGQIIILSYNS